jgi:tRNA pseudouridine13 synthase
VTRELPGCGGLIKVVPEDFEVEELPSYPPSGEGEHLFLWIEKRGLTTQEAVGRLARALGVTVDDCGYAGLKDRQAVTRQLISVPARAEPRLSDVSQGASLPLQVLWAKRHGHKLRTGHLQGNRFRVRLRTVRDRAAAEAVVAALKKRGVPNYFGDQRFGRADDNAQKGKALLLGQRLERAPSRFQRKLFLSAYQSLLFNRALARRLESGTFARALEGDVLRRADSGGLFVCTDPLVDQPRVDRFEVSPSGPLFGPKMRVAEREVARGEQALLEEEGISVETFRHGRGETEGGRRAFRLQLQGCALTPEGEDLWLSFELPRGSYATVVLREICKPLALDSGEGPLHGEDEPLE